MQRFPKNLLNTTRFDLRGETNNDEMRGFFAALRMTIRKVSVRKVGRVQLRSICVNVCVMEITEAQYERIKDALPVQRGNVRLNNLQVLNAVLYIAEQGCKCAVCRAFRALAPILYADESLVEDRRSGPRVRKVAGRADRSHQDRGRFASDSDLDQGASDARCSKKKGPQCYRQVARGWNTKVHLVAGEC